MTRVRTLDNNMRKYNVRESANPLHFGLQKIKLNVFISFSEMPDDD